MRTFQRNEGLPLRNRAQKTTVYRQSGKERWPSKIGQGVKVEGSCSKLQRIERSSEHGKEDETESRGSIQ
ncbi:MAG: hypothetical protein FD164_2248, partial [Nitrospirae bacterium]